MKKRICIMLGLCAALALAGMATRAATVGQKLVPVKLLNLVKKGDAEVWSSEDIPWLGKKVISIMYTDVDVSDINDPLSDAIKKSNPDGNRYLPLGIGNSKDAPFKPDWAIRIVGRKKLKQYVGSVIVLDETRAFSKANNLGDCNDRAVVMIVDRNLVIRYIRKIGSKEESARMIPEFMAVLNALIR